MVSQKLSQAISLIKAGDKQAAFPILRQLIQEEPNNEQVWLWMFACTDRPEQKRYCLQKALEINPNNNDARKALEKLSGNVPPPAPIEPAQSKVQQSPVYQQLPAARPQARTSQPARKKQPASNRNLLLIGGAVVVLLICATVGIGGNWIYKKYVANGLPIAGMTQDPYNDPFADGDQNNPNESGQSNTDETQEPYSDGDPNNTDGSNDGGDNSFPTPIVVTGNDNTPSAPSGDDYGIRIVPVSYTKTLTTDDPKWSNLEITLAVENHSEESRSVSITGYNTSKVTTQQGFEYGCGMTYQRVKLPPKFRYKVKGECLVPTDSSGYNVSLNADLGKIDLQGEVHNLSKIDFDINIEHQNVNLIYPLFDREYYSRQQQIPFYAPNQLIEFPDLTISYFSSPYKDGGQTISVRAQNKSIGSNVFISVWGSLFTPEGLVLEKMWGLPDSFIEIGGGTTEFSISPLGSESVLPDDLSNSCFFVYAFSVDYAPTLTSEPEIPQLQMICF